jgi:hypothetical protein
MHLHAHVSPACSAAALKPSSYFDGSRTTALTGAFVTSSKRLTHSKPVGPPAPSTTLTDMLIADSWHSTKARKQLRHPGNNWMSVDLTQQRLDYFSSACGVLVA